VDSVMSKCFSKDDTHVVFVRRTAAPVVYIHCQGFLVMCARHNDCKKRFAITIRLELGGGGLIPERMELGQLGHAAALRRAALVLT